jgi:NAD(P)H-dependent FMN reductase
MKLAIIIGSTRPGRVTERLARWVINEAKELPQTELDIICLFLTRQVLRVTIQTVNCQNPLESS